MSFGLRIDERAAASSTARGTSLNTWQRPPTASSSSWWVVAWRRSARDSEQGDGVGPREWTQVVDRFIRMAERDTARGEHRGACARTQHDVDDPGGGIADVFAVVEHQQSTAARSMTTLRSRLAGSEAVAVRRLRATVSSTRSASSMEARSTTWWSCQSAASVRARLVLPTPPSPTRVTSRCSSSRPAAVSTSALRPIGRDVR